MARRYSKPLTPAQDRLLRYLALDGLLTRCRPRSGGDRSCMEALVRRGLLRHSTSADRDEWPYVLTARGSELGEALARAHEAEREVRRLGGTA